MIFHHVHCFRYLGAAFHRRFSIISYLHLLSLLDLDRSIALLLFPPLVRCWAPVSVHLERCNIPTNWPYRIIIEPLPRPAREFHSFVQIDQSRNIYKRFIDFSIPCFIQLRGAIRNHLLKSLVQEGLIVIESIRVIRHDVVEKHLARPLVALELLSLGNHFVLS